MNNLARFTRARIEEDLDACEEEIKASGGVPREDHPTSPARVMDDLRVKLRVVDSFESYANNPKVHMDVALYALMSTLRAIVTDFARAYEHHPDYPEW